jgi:hypothetical protein
VDLLNDLRLARLASLSSREAAAAGAGARALETGTQSAEGTGIGGFFRGLWSSAKNRFGPAAVEFAETTRKEWNIGPLILKHSPDEIKRAIALEVAAKLGKTRDSAHAFFRQFEPKMAKMNSKHLKAIEEARTAGRAVPQASREFQEHYAKFEKMVDELKNTPVALDEFLEKNAHVMAEIVDILPNRWRDLGISIVMEGGFGNYGLEGLKRLYLAQDRLLVFRFRELARVELGLGGSGAMRHSSGTVVRQVEQLALQSGDASMVQAVGAFHEKLAVKLAAEHRIAASEITRMMKSKELKDIAAFDEIFARTDPKKIFENLPELKTLASKVLEENARFGDDLSMLERALSAQQTLLYLDRPARVRRFLPGSSPERVFRPGTNGMIQ